MAGYQKQRQREYFAVELQVSEERGAIGLAAAEDHSKGSVHRIHPHCEPACGESEWEIVNMVAYPIELFFHPFHLDAIL